MHSRCRLSTDIAALTSHATDDQEATIQTRINTLRRKIATWIEVQHLYIPPLHVVRSMSQDRLPDEAPEDRVEDILLYLPSAIPSTIQFDLRLCEIEWSLRHAQANEALDDLCDSLRLRSYLYIDKDRFQRGQYANTRSRSMIHRVEVRVAAAVTKYRTARLALNMLGARLGKVGWALAFPVLKDSDIRGLSDPEGNSSTRQAGPSEGRRTLSWIWTRLGDGTEGNEDEHLHEGNIHLSYPASTY